MPAILLIVLYLGLVCAPLGLAMWQDQPALSLRDALAAGAGMAGLAILQVEFLLSGRFRVISGRIGMDVTMRLHQLLARAASVLILLHPFLYHGPQGLSRGRGPGPGPGANAALDYSWASLWPGLAAWLLLGAVMVMALGRDGLFRHERWRLMHGTMALAMAGLGVLHATRAGRFSSDPVLAGYWWAMLGVATLSLCWVYAVKPMMKRARPWRVAAVTPLAERTWELRLSPEGHSGLRYKPGHFAWISVGHSALSLDENPFSIASSPSDGPDLRFVIKELGDFTNRLGAVKPGTPAYVDAPFGSLTLDGHGDAAGVALIAGGVGIAPMLSHLRALDAAGDPRPRLLIHANRLASQMVCDDELQAMTQHGPLRVVHVLSEPSDGWTGETGFVTPDLLRRHLDTDALKTWVFVLCGPPPMLESVEPALLAMGVPHRNILLEQFSYD
ncbi:ferredoxin reductase family protein [Thetidibacter halocola]|uniref:Ferredoxin reductase family protein n=1 Tax=Thetidibacter halocola TaxID=2827239 RepID=A0A8J7WEZ2_9RHOB|nr:ferredoxin reductase family protein [Thetidibacter halocola]MBS0125562.1 ferredoxin reductase family protein [Thetidibacter halocola]